MPERPQSYYFDAVTLSNFALSGHLDLLVRRYGQSVWITPAVLEEVLDGIVTGYRALGDIEAAVTEGTLRLAPVLNDIERDSFRDMLRVLSLGEASCIACAQNRGGIVVTDDRAARNACQERGVAFTGTIGILKACCREATITPHEADAILQAMVDVGYFSPVRSISRIV